MSWWNDNWTSAAEFYTDNSLVDSNLAYFTVKVELSSSNFDFSEAKADGTDIRFVLSDDVTELKFEREYHDNSGQTALYWVKIPSVLSASDVSFYCYYGNPSASDGQDVNGTWDTGVYEAVHHMTDDPGTSNIADSTSNGYDGAKASANNPLEAVGDLYKSQNFSSDYIDLGNTLNIAGNGGIEAYIKPNSLGNNCILVRSDPSVGEAQYADISLLIWGGKLSCWIGDASGISGYQFFDTTLTPTTGVWQYVACKVDGSNITVFLGNTKQTLAQTKTPAGNSHDYRMGQYGELGTHYFDGLIDELRVNNVAVSDAWNKATKENLESNLVLYSSTKFQNFADIATDIRTKYTDGFEDIDVDVRVSAIGFEDIDTDIRARYTEGFADIDTDIRLKAEIFEDIDVDIRVVDDVILDIDTDIRLAEAIFLDIDTDIRLVERNFADISTDIRTVYAASLNSTIVEESPHLEEGYYLTNQNVNIVLDKIYNAIEMQFKNESGVWSAWEVFSTSKSWVTSGGDGLKKIYVKFKDIKGQESDGAHFVEAIFTTIPPPAVNIEAYTDDTAAIAIPASTYQTDKTPFFRWEVPVSVLSYVGFSYSLDVAPDDVIDIAIRNIVRNGMVVSKATPLPEMTVEASDGYYYYANDLKRFDTQSVTLDNGGAQDRIDVIYISAVMGSLQIEKGTEAATPVVPTIDEVDYIVLAEVYVPAGTVNVANVTLTDIRERHIEIYKWLNESLDEGQHTLYVKGFTSDGSSTAVASFNIWVAAEVPTQGEIKCYTDSGKLTELENGIYQTTDNTPYFEWTVSPSQPGPILYYYTADGTEPDLGDSSTSNNYLNLGPYAAGTIILKVKAYDTTTLFWGDTKEFVFVYGTQTFTDDTAVISGSITKKQSLKEIHVKKISWDFDSARTCEIFYPVPFDDTLPFTYGDPVVVVYGASNDTVFSGKVKLVRRTIDYGKEGVTYYCTGPRGDLVETSAYIIDPDAGETANISFEDEPIVNIIDTLLDNAGDVVKDIESYPTGENITDDFVGQKTSEILDSVYAKTKYGWYVKPNGKLASVDLTADNPGQAKFGIYGTTVNAISPQFNVMSSDLDFDISNRYNRCIIEGSKKQLRVRLPARCATNEVLSLVGTAVNEGDARFKVYKIDTKWKVIKVIETFVTFAKLLGYAQHPLGSGGRLGFGDSINGFWIGFLKTEIVENNNMLNSNRERLYGNFPDEIKLAKEKDIDLKPRVMGFSGWSYFNTVFPQGSLGPINTIRFSEPAFNMWPKGARTDVAGITVPATQGNLSSAYGGAITVYWRDRLDKKCATVFVDCIIETVPLKVDVTVPGTASSLSKTLRLVNESFGYSEDPDDLIDDTAKLTAYAEDILQRYKDINITGSIILDTIDLTLDLDKTVNLINTDHVGWDSLNAKVIGITYDFDQNTTRLEISTEYLR